MADLSAHDQSEIRRSAVDAARHKAPLAANPKQVARYLNPRLDTAFPLEYCYSLLGDMTGKTALDYGCGSGENVLLLTIRGASVVGVDISPDLIEIAKQRLSVNNLTADLRPVSGYDTEMPDASVDVVFCMAVLHHLDLEKARHEILRVLKPGGVVILREPVRNSKTYAALRGLIPFNWHNVSEFEHPLRSEDLDAFAAGMQCEAKRRFRLPFVNLAIAASQPLAHRSHYIDRWLLKKIPRLERMATVEVRKLRAT